MYKCSCGKDFSVANRVEALRACDLCRPYLEEAEDQVRRWAHHGPKQGDDIDLYMRHAAAGTFKLYQ